MGSAAGAPTRSSTLDCSQTSGGWETVLLSPRQGLCRSRSKSDLFHTVTHWPNKGWCCDSWCDDFRFNRTCDHVRKVQRKIAEALAARA